jgi:hypothetical protein
MQFTHREHAALLSILGYGLRGGVVFRPAELLDTDLNLVVFPRDPRNHIYDVLYYVGGLLPLSRLPPEAVPLPQWEHAQVRCLHCDGSILLPPGFVRSEEGRTVFPCPICEEWYVSVRAIPPN